MINVDALIEQFKFPLDEGWGYIWGAVGQLWTQKKQDAATRPMTVKHGQKWVGKHVIDCSGMFYRAYKNLGHYIYHGSNTIWKQYCSARGTLTGGARSDGQPIKPGTAVFLYRKSNNNRHHIGLYIGGGICIEAKGTINGVVTSKLSHWDEWGELKDVDYTGIKGDEPIMTQILKRGSRGAAVQSLQEMLNALGYDAGTADGIYGSRTESAVRQFQLNNALESDGVAGPKTLETLAARSAVPETGQADDDAKGDDLTASELPEDDDDFDEPVQMIPLTWAEVERIRAALREIEKILDRASR